MELHLLALVFLFLTAVPKERLGIRVRVPDRKCNFRSFRPLLPSPLPRSQFLLISDFFASFVKGETTEIFKLLQFYPTFYLKDINRSPRTRGNGGDLGTKHFPPFGWSFKKNTSFGCSKGPQIHQFTEMAEGGQKLKSQPEVSIGYDENFLTAVDEDYICLICHLALREPVLTDSVESVSISVLNGKLKVQEVLSEDLSLLNLKFCHKS